MIQQIMVYAIAVAAVLGVAGWGMERLAALQGRPRRSAWIVALLLSVLLPLFMIRRAEPVRIAEPLPAPVMVAASAPEISIPATQPETVVADLPAPRRADPVSITPQPETLQRAVQPVPQPPRPPREWHVPQLSDRTLLQAWVIASLLSGLYLIGANLRLRRRIAGCQRATLLGHQVLISDSMGPALIGALRPRMVVPRWLLDEPATTRSLILEHERQHIAARDPLLIRAVVVLLAALPWNLPLWWQWRRMRQAIELDCDARVLRTGVEPQTYGEVLLSITGRAARMPSVVVAMSEPVSALERRIQNLLPDPVRHAALQAIGAIALLAASVGTAIAMDAPTLPARAPLQAQSAPSSAATQPTIPTPMTIEAMPPITPPVAGVLAAAAAATAAAPATATSNGGGTSLRDLALRAAVLKYPELINGTVLPDYYYVAIVVRADGSVFRSSLATMHSLMALHGFESVTEGPQTAKIPMGQQIADMGKASNNIEALWRVLPADYDESRDSRRVAAVVRAKRADLMLANPSIGSPMPNINLLTVFMSEDGQIAREHVELLDDAQYKLLNPQPVNSEAIVNARGEPYTSYNPPPVPTDAFKVLGLDAAQIGQTGLLLVNTEFPSGESLRQLPRNQQQEAMLTRFVLVRYAWPRRSGEPIGGNTRAVAAPTAQRTQFVPTATAPLPQAAAPIAMDAASRLDKAMRAMVQKYPYLISGPEKEGCDSLSMAVAKDGRVIYSGILNLTTTPDPILTRDFTITHTVDLFTVRRETAIPDTGLGTAKFPLGKPVGSAGIASRNIVAEYYMLPADYDESRGISKVANAVREKHDNLMLAEVALVGGPEMFRDTKRALLENGGKLDLTSGLQPRPRGTPPPRDTQIINLLTVFMTEDGKIAQQFVEQKTAEALQAILPLPVEDEGSISMSSSPWNSFNPPPVPAEAFKVLGLAPEQIGPTGYVIVHRIGTVARPVNSLVPPGVVVRYAWPRRSAEPISGKAPATSAPTAQRTQFVPTTPAPLPQATAPIANAAPAQDLVQVSASDLVLAASWAKRTDSYVLQLVLDRSTPMPRREGSTTNPTTSTNPITSLTREDMYRLGIRNMADDRAQLAPQNSTPPQDRSTSFIVNTTPNLRDMGPWLQCGRSLTLVDARRVVPGAQPAPAPQISYMNQPYPPEHKERRVDVWLLKTDGSQILPATYSCEAGPVSQPQGEPQHPIEVSYQFPVADGEQAVAAAIRIDDTYYIEKLQRPAAKPAVR